MSAYKITTLEDGRRGYFYRTRITGNLLFQQVDDDDCSFGPPELWFDDDEKNE